LITLERMPVRKALSDQALLEKDHLMLPVEVVGPACELADDMQMLCGEWKGGGTSMGNALWFDFILNVLKDAEGELRRHNSRVAFSLALGLLLFMRAEDGWLLDQEVYMDWKLFSGFFRRITALWKSLLALSDAKLGFAPRRGRIGGYRERLRSLLEEWQHETNEVLEESFDFHRPASATGPAQVRVRICA